MRYINNFLEKMKEKNIVINYIQVYKDGKIKEEYSRLDTKTRLNVCSVSKSVTSLGIGIAIDEGLLKLDEPIYKFFKEIDFEKCDSKVRDITVRHLLTMTCGVKGKLFFMDDEERYVVKDLIKYFFSREFSYVPGDHFEYCNFNTYILGCIIERVTGQTLIEYMTPRFFDKLGIGNPDWLSCPMNHTAAAHSLMLTIDEMTKIGILLLNNGVYNNEKIVSKEYLEIATKNQIKNNTPKYGYGFQFWINKDLKSYRADGKYGQYIIVVPESNLVVSMQALDSKKFYDDVWEELIIPIINE
ncbi:serine hydrolase domain-containing protein [Clostridium nigeriense]|uniref:serine hydrolase domain-containing protein n=1 Tax=Clostridium nigeriense TaxID=1805470 RepID=UPI003D3396AC